MKFSIVHEFKAQLPRVEEAAFDPKLFPYLATEMSDIVKEIELLEQEDQGDRIIRKVRYLSHPIIRKIGPKEVPENFMEWVENSVYDRNTRIMTFKNIPTATRVKELMTNEGSFRLESKGEEMTIRKVEGLLKIRFPILGMVAERVIYSHAKKILNDEAAAFARFVQSQLAKE